jgi:3-hydroxyacyl-[acyl-carrier-protein] dehydratase
MGWIAAMQDPLAALPHGQEFRFVDALETLDPGKSATARYLVRGDEAFLAGHFPGNPLMPGVILIEAIAQLGGVVAQSDPVISPLENLLLTGVRGAKILGAAKPGEVLTLKAEVEGRLGGMIQVSGEVSVGDRPLASAKIMLSGQERAS